MGQDGWHRRGAAAARNCLFTCLLVVVYLKVGRDAEVIIQVVLARVEEYLIAYRIAGYCKFVDIDN